MSFLKLAMYTYIHHPPHLPPTFHLQTCTQSLGAVSMKNFKTFLLLLSYQLSREQERHRQGQARTGVEFQYKVFCLVLTPLAGLLQGNPLLNHTFIWSTLNELCLIFWVLFTVIKSTRVHTFTLFRHTQFSSSFMMKTISFGHLHSICKI